MSILTYYKIALPRSSNLDRAKWRTKYREKLLKYISKIYTLLYYVFCLILIRYNRKQARDIN